MEDKKVSTTLLGHEIVLQDVVANVARVVEFAFIIGLCSLMYDI